MMTNGALTPEPVAPTLRMPVILEAQQWNQVLTQLADGPYRIVAPLIQAIAEQLRGPPPPQEDARHEAA